LPQILRLAETSAENAGSGSPVLYSLLLQEEETMNLATFPGTSKTSRRLGFLAAAALVCCAILVTAKGTAYADGPLKLESTACPDAVAGTNYTCVLPIAGGAIPYTVSAKGLPQGLRIEMFSSAITGRPMAAGTFSPVVTVKDGSNPPMSSDFTVQIKVAPAGENPAK
jgi:hypothetical protein